MSRGVVWFSAQDWWYFSHAHSDFQLATRLAERQPVLLVNSLGMRMPMPGRSTRVIARLRRKAASVAKGLQAPLSTHPDFHVLSPVFAPVYGGGRLWDANVRLVRIQVARAMSRLGLADPDMVVTLPTAWEVARGLPHRHLMANRSDRYSSFSEADGEWVAGLEADLLAHADVAAYASRALLEAESPLTNRPVFLDHGVDLDLFAPAADVPEPEDLRAVPRPRIGFFGTIDDYTVDIGLLERLADELPHAQVVLVGPTNCALDALTARPNVSYLGPRAYEVIARYGAGFDVAIMPWVDNEWIRHCNPIKLKEYLALGLPVVTMPFPEVDRYSTLVRVAGSRDEFVSMVALSLADGGLLDVAARRAAVVDDGWNRRADFLGDLLASPGSRDLLCAGS
jgi:glycosyltransferase involved in cell wall biosynthesis